MDIIGSTVGFSSREPNQQVFLRQTGLAEGAPSRVADIMNMEPTPSDREILAGLVERVTYQNADNGFCVLRVKARGHRDLVTLVGHAATISAGEWITATGDWVNDRCAYRKSNPSILVVRSAQDRVTENASGCLDGA